MPFINLYNQMTHRYIGLTLNFSVIQILKLWIIISKIVERSNKIEQVVRVYSPSIY